MRAMATRASSGDQPEFRAGVSGGHRRVGARRHAGDDPHQARLHLARRHDALEPVDVVEVVDHDQTHAAADGQFDLLVGLGIAVHDEPGGIGARGDGGQDLAAAGHVEVQPLLGHHSLNCGAREGF